MDDKILDADHAIWPELLIYESTPAMTIGVGGDPRLYNTATQSISISNGPGHDGTWTKIRAGDSAGK